MNKLKEILVKLQVPTVAFSLYLAKLLILPASFQDGIIFICLSAVLGFKYNIDRFKTKDINEQIKEDVKIMKDYISKSNVGKIEKRKVRF